MTDADVAEACKLLMAGKKPKEIAPRWGVHPTNMLYRCRQVGLRLKWGWADAP